MTHLAQGIMQTEVLTVSPETTVAELADVLIGKHVGGMPVIEEGAAGRAGCS